MPPNDESLLAPPELMHSSSVVVFSGRPISYASSEDGMLVVMSLSSMDIGHPVPMLA